MLLPRQDFQVKDSRIGMLARCRVQSVLMSGVTSHTRCKIPFCRIKTLNLRVSSFVRLLPNLSFACIEKMAGCPRVMDTCRPFATLPIKDDRAASNVVALTIRSNGLA